MAAERLRIGVDPDEGVFDEWAQTCGLDAVRQLITHWHDLNGFRELTELGRVPAAANKALRQLGFGEKTIDKLLLRIALALEDRIILSEDSDFWRPRRPQLVGNHNAPVAAYLRDELDVTVHTLVEVLAHVRNV